MPKGFFDNVIRWEFEREGTRRTLPYFYYDNTSLTAIFLASSSKIRGLLPHQDMKPVEIVPGRCMVAFSAFEYRKTDFEPYNELSISFQISFRRRQIPGITAAKMMLSRATSSYIWQLPVTAEHARAGGVDLFGYPKFLAEIGFETNEDWITCTLAERGRDILRLRGRKLVTHKGKFIRHTTFSVGSGVPLVAEVLVNPLEYAEAYDGSTVQLELGTSHHICDVLRQIGLSKRARMYQYSPVNEAILFPAHNIISDTY